MQCASRRHFIRRAGTIRLSEFTSALEKAPSKAAAPWENRPQTTILMIATPTPLSEESFCPKDGLPNSRISIFRLSKLPSLHSILCRTPVLMQMIQCGVGICHQIPRYEVRRLPNIYKLRPFFGVHFRVCCRSWQRFQMKRPGVQQLEERRWPAPLHIFGPSRLTSVNWQV